MDQRPRPRSERRGPHKATEDSLKRAAHTYLSRTASSADNLRRVLMRRVERSARAHGTDRTQGAAAVADIVAALAGAGLIDDRRYAEARAAALSRRGVSARGIRGRLAAKGVAPEAIEQAIGGLAEGAGQAEVKAASKLARRRRLGPYRRPAERAARRARDLAALCRAGFDFDIAVAVIDAENPEADPR